MTTKRHCNHCDGTTAQRWINLNTFVEGIDPKLQSGKYVFADDVAKLDGDFCSPACLVTWVAAGFPATRSILTGSSA
jgi:hypothetical protein